MGERPQLAVSPVGEVAWAIHDRRCLNSPSEHKDGTGEHCARFYLDHAEAAGVGFPTRPTPLPGLLPVSRACEREGGFSVTEAVVHLDGLVVERDQWLVLVSREGMTYERARQIRDQIPSDLHGRVLVVDGFNGYVVDHPRPVAAPDPEPCPEPECPYTAQWCSEVLGPAHGKPSYESRNA
jgi:hypothetical protein